MAAWTRAVVRLASAAPCLPAVAVASVISFHSMTASAAATPGTARRTMTSSPNTLFMDSSCHGSDVSGCSVRPNSAITVVGSPDFSPDSIDRIARRLAEQIEPFSPIDDDEPGEFDAFVGELFARTILSHLIPTGRYHVKSEDPISANALGRGDISASVEGDDPD